MADAMGEPLTFGTAGIRGEVGPGSGRMNRATVIRTTRGLADYLITKHNGPPERPVALGFDARPDSRTFAEDTAGVLAAAGIGVRFFPEVTPTPLVAFAAKHLDAPAAVVITASHNPPADNGYKVYDRNAAQIIPPTDAEIAAAIERVGPAGDVPRIEGVFAGGIRSRHTDARGHPGCLRARIGLCPPQPAEVRPEDRLHPAPRCRRRHPDEAFRLGQSQWSVACRRNRRVPMAHFPRSPSPTRRRRVRSTWR